MRWRNTVAVGVAALAGLAAVPGLAGAGTTGYGGSTPVGTAGYGGYGDTSIGASAFGALDRELRLPGTAPGWARPQAKVGEIDDEQVREVHIGLSLRNGDGAQRVATAVSTPGNREYGQFLSSSEFTARFGPTRDTVHAVSRWLRSRGLDVKDVSDNRQLITAEASVAKLEKAFDVRLSSYRHRQPGGTRVTVAPDQDVAVPAKLKDRVNTVLGLSDTIAEPLNEGARAAQPKPADEGCAPFWGARNNTAVPQKYPKGKQSNYLCGYDTKQARGIYGLKARHSGRGQHVGIVGVYNLKTIESDSNRAAARYGSPPLTPGQYRGKLPSKFEHQDKCDPPSWASEQAMDVQAVHALAPSARITYYAARSCTNPHIYAALNRAVEDNKVSIISNSWGFPDEADLPASAHRQFGQIAVQAAAQGQTLLFSSGDSGDASGHVGKRQLLFPAASPWVTAAGGTTVAADAAGKQQFVTGWENSGNTLSAGKWKPQWDKDGPFAGGAGGGRSAYYQQPAYQRGVVPSSFARGKRTLPDIAALADGYTGMGIGFTTDEGEYVFASGGGTSLAAPLLAGMVADAQQVKGGKRFGFLNPALYKMTGSKVITDVKPVKAGIWTDLMASYGGVHVPPKEGHYLVDLDTKPQTLQSARGWDPVTGIGTPTTGFVDRLGR